MFKFSCNNVICSTETSVTNIVTIILHTHIHTHYTYTHISITVAFNIKFPYSKRTTHVQLAYCAASTLRYVRSLYTLQYVYAHITNIIN